MAISSITPSTYQTPGISEAAKGSGKNYGYIQETPYHQASASGIKSFTQLTDDMEKIASQRVASGDNFFMQGVAKPSARDPRGARWEGFDISQYDVNNPNSKSETQGQNLYLKG